MELTFSSKEKFVGLFVVGVSLLLLTTMVLLGRGNDWFVKYATFYTVFDESYNLQENASVKLFKTDIGKVKQITLVENEVRVELAIQEKYRNRIRKSTVALVESPTIIGSEYISIDPGDPGSSLLMEGGEIQSRAKKSIDDILDEFQVEKTARMFLKAVQDLAQTAEQINDPKGSFWRTLSNIETTTDNIANITADIQSGKGSLGELIKSKALIASIMKNLETTEAFLEIIHKASKKTPKTMDLVNATLSSTKRFGNDLEKGMAKINLILDDINKSTQTLGYILENVKDGSSDVPEITRTTREGIEEIRQGVENVEKVVKSLQKSILIRSNLPPEPVAESTDAGLR